MKRIISLSAVTLLASMAVEAQESFTITGNVPGVTPGYTVELVNRDAGARDGWRKVEGKTTEGGFTITGSVEMPTLCEIRIDSNSEGSMDRIIDVMVENMPIEISVAHVDSLAPSFFTGTGGLYQKRNVTVKGGEAQREYEQYFEAMFPYEEAARQAHYNLYWDDKAKKTDEEEARLKEAYDKAGEALDSAQTKFMNDYPAYHISAMQWQRVLGDPFVYTNEELDSIWSKVSANSSPARREALARVIEGARKHVRGQKYTDFSAVDPDGVEHKLSDYVGDGHYTMVDFWASWCGPCRAAIPHVRELHKKYGDRLAICAVSVDEEDAAWRKAMEQEKMDWTQLRVPREGFRDITRAYNFSGIPFMVLINPEGHIVFAGHDPVKVSAILAEALGE